MPRHRLLLVEDSPSDRLLVAEALAGDPEADYEIVAVDRLALALDRLRAGGIDVVVLDLGLPDSRGEETYRRTRAAAPELPIVVCASGDDEALGLRLLREGADELLVKGAGAETVRRVVRYGLERTAARRLRLALSALVSGVAHEITNPIHGILLSAQLLGKAWQDLQPLLDARFQDDPDARVGNVAYSQVRAWIPEVIADIQSGAERIKSIVAALREHAREERAAASRDRQG